MNCSILAKDFMNNSYISIKNHRFSVVMVAVNETRNLKLLWSKRDLPGGAGEPTKRRCFLKDLDKGFLLPSLQL